MKTTFPDGFLWGTSTAAAQIETAFDHQWKGEKSLDGHLFERTCDHELRRDEDVEIIAQFGTVYRCGVDWSKLQRAPFAELDAATVGEYSLFFEKLNQRGMKIMFVLHHFANPRWFEAAGGWLEAANIPPFLDFCEKCIHHFGGFASFWNTFNEPNVYAMNGFITGGFPPHQKGKLHLANRVLKNMGRAHDLVFDLLKKNDASKPVGISLNTALFEGKNWLGWLPAKFCDWWFHVKSASFFEKNCDFWGISYYAWALFDPLPITEIDRPGELDRLGIPRDNMWGYNPEGLGRILRRFSKKYGKPIFITENGICTDDPARRIGSIKDYLTVIKSAMGDGVAMLGYIHWSTFDNFEWHLGPTFRFGLVRVDFGTMEREMTEAGLFYSKIARENGF